jgi:hypothetical protein
MLTYLLTRLNNKPTIIQFSNRDGNVYTIPLKIRFKNQLNKQTTFKEWNKKWIKK